MTRYVAFAALLGALLIAAACGPTNRPHCRYDGDAPAVTDRAVCEEQP